MFDLAGSGIRETIMLYMNSLASVLAGSGYGDTWRICTVINNVRDLLRFWGSALIMCIGVVMCIVGIWKIAQAPSRVA